MNTSDPLIKIIFVCVLGICCPDQYGQDIVINEVMSDNDFTIKDGLTNYSDWIELYNRGSSLVNLKNYYLSDDLANLKKWKMPDYSLGPGEFQLIFASDKDTAVSLGYWNSVISRGDEWKYLVGLLEPPAGWKEIGFPDSSWERGPTGIGYGDNDDATVIDSVITVYFRKSFVLGDVQSVIRAILDIDFDDGFVAYLNGVEFARENISGYPPTFEQEAELRSEPRIHYGEKPARYELSEQLLGLLQTGENVLSVQVHNKSIESSDFTFIPFFTIGYSEESFTGPVDPLLDIQSHGNLFHANFKISSGGELLLLSDSVGNLTHAFFSIKLQGDQSYGRRTDGSEELMIFDFPSPGKSNIHSNSLTFSHDRGFYRDPFYLKITSDRNTPVYYTLDGSMPTDSSFLYQDSLYIGYLYEKPNGISLMQTTQSLDPSAFTYYGPPDEGIAKATVLKSRSILEGVPTSPVYTSTFFIDSLGTDHYSLPVFSLVLDSFDLFDYNTGIYVPGLYSDSTNSRSGNFYETGMEWEKKAHIEYFDTVGNVAFSQYGGIRIHGGISRKKAQKSLRLYSRNKYGNKYFEYPLFASRNTGRYKRVILRSSMSTWGSKFGDGYVATVCRDLDFELQETQPVIVFINGEYWGLHNMRDYIDEYYLKSLSPEIDKDSVNLLEKNEKVKIGFREEYTELMNFIKLNDLAKQENYTYVSSRIDVPNYIDYNIAELFLANADWPGNNSMYWKSQASGTKWRWILHDMDGAFFDAETDMFKLATDSTQTAWPNPSWSTFLLRNMFLNYHFRRQFMCRAIELFESDFHPDTMIRKAIEFNELFLPEIEEHMARWHYPGSRGGWDYYYNELVYDFAVNRPAIFMEHMMDYFGLTYEEILASCESFYSGSEPPEQVPTDLKVYPNPNQGSFIVDLPRTESDGGELSVFNLMGQIVYIHQIRPSELSHAVKLNSPAPAIYIVRYVSGSKSCNRRMVVH